MIILGKIFAGVLGLIGLGLLGGGIWLAVLGGSLYYLIVGAAYVVAAVQMFRQRPAGAQIVVLVAIATVIWSFWESGASFWPLFARLMAPIALAAFAMLFAPFLSEKLPRKTYIGGAVVALVLFVLGFVFAFQPHGIVTPGPEITAYERPAGDNAPSDWTAYGRDTMGRRFAPFDQINADNVDQLDLAWTFETGRELVGYDQNTPLQIDDKVYTCSTTNVISALNGDTGEEEWRFDPQATAPFWQRCRGVGSYQVPAAQLTEGQQCAKRLIMTTIDARLMAIDAETGELCQDFGTGGTVSLAAEMGKIIPGFYFQTSAPLVARDKIVVGGWVVDNQMVGEPSGVIRAFDVMTGELEWAWDLGNPSITRLPPEGETYTLGTPNMWTTAAYDDELGLIYAPLGNTTPDYFGGERPPFADEYNAALVALDIETGREQWKFKTVNHDIWDYDLPSQPALVDLPDGSGGTVPAVLQTTKRGQIFLLNRETGAPLAEVEERPVPQTGQAPGEYLAETQPYSVGMPQIVRPTLTEARMWGTTMFDQLACRIQFRQMRYEGDFTPIGLDQWVIQNPGNIGGMNWGSMSVDTVNNRVFVNDIRVPNRFKLVPTEAYEDFAGSVPRNNAGHGPSPQRGTPYGMATGIWLSPVGVPCVEPPFGTITAIDLNTREIAWQTPAGTAEQLGPLGLKLGLPMPMGMPTYAGTAATAGGLVFFAGFQDYYIRAYDAATGAELWKYPLPVGSSATPMTYVSPETGRQFVLVSVGGAAQSPEQGDYVMAFALPAE